MKRSTSVVAILVLGGYAGALGCGSADAAGASAADASGDDAAEVALGDDASLLLDGAPSAIDGSASDGALADGAAPCADTKSDPANCGACGNKCGAGQACVAGACTCPPYESLCGGVCIPTSNDPANCGACGTKCAAGSVCSASACASGCLTGLSACAGACVDPKSDSKNCGACGHACGAGQGCADGACVTAAPLGTPPAGTCVGGGPPIDLGGPKGPKCAGGVAKTTFTWAVCSCKDVTTSSKLITDGFDSSKGGYKPGDIGAGVGLDGNFAASSVVDVGGTLWSSAAGGVHATSDVNVAYELHAGGPLASARFGVAAESWINGSATGGPFTFGKLVHLPVGATAAGVPASQLVHEPITVPPPCACGASELLPIAAIVVAHKTANDDALIGLAPDLLSKPGAPQRVDLPCGQFYLDAIDVTTPLSIVAHGRTALYVGGDVHSGSALTITLDPGAELDLVIGGTITTSAALTIGSPNYPAMSRTYVGGAQELVLTSDSVLATNLYAPLARTRFTSNTTVFGSVFSGDFVAESEFTVHYDRHVVALGGDCPKPGGGPGGDAGTLPDGAPNLDGGSSVDGGAGGCGSCRDCGNQACINGSCSSCTASSQCCAPLVCMGGSCSLPIR
jgi:hypothetical protein